MDSAVVAALITTPTAGLAAAAAYAAGRAQARSAQRGPVDAVRRQHQRDAYAELIRAAWSYVGSTGKVLRLVHELHGARLPYPLALEPGLFRLSQVMRDLSRPLRRDELASVFAPDEVPQVVADTFGVLEMLSPTWQQAVRDAGDFHQVDDLVVAEVVVALEGPDHLAELAEQLRRHAEAVQRCWHQVAAGPFMRFGRESDPEQSIPPRELHGRLEEAVKEFTRAASVHLNAY